MLGKLLKHEWKQTWKLPAFILLAAMVITLIGVGSFFTPLWNNDSSFLLTFTGYLFLFITVILLIASILAIFVYFSIRFYKNLFTDEGYLMHTLPVTCNQLIWGKFFIFLFWLVVSGILVSLCGTALLLAWDQALDLNILETFRELGQALHDYGFVKLMGELNEACRTITGLPVLIFAILYVLSIIINIFHVILTPYFAISIGQLFSRFKLAASIGIYIAILIIQQTVAMIITFPINMSLMAKQIDSVMGLYEYKISTFYAMYAPPVIMTLVLTVLFYFFTHNLMKKHLNLD